MKNAQDAAQILLGQVFVLSNYVLKYARDHRVKYISHLDFIKMFHRAVRRAGLTMEFSQGFNPHPIMTVAMPLSVGVTADAELCKIGFAEDYTPEEIKNRLNDTLPGGYVINEVVKTEGKEHDFSKLDRAVYEVELESSGDFDADKFLENRELVVMKKTKSGEKEADIREYIYDFSVTEKTDGEMKITMCLAAGNLYNLKPDTVILAMEKYTDEFSVEFFCVHRAKILAGKKELI